MGLPLPPNPNETMKRSLLVLAALAPVLAAGCASKPQQIEDHWNARSIAPRTARVMTGYTSDEHGSYLDYQWKVKQERKLMAQRHFLNWNPENPFQADDPSYNAPRPKNSPLPNLPSYVLSLDQSLAGTISEGGAGEFVDGFATTARPIGVTITTVTGQAKRPRSEREYSDLNPNVPVGQR